MQRINWDKFRIINTDYQKAFEELCYNLFCRKFKLYEGITTYHNQPGIESEPIEIDGKWYGFQSKFFEINIEGKQIEDSITTAINKYNNLDVILIYLNRNPGPTNKYQEKVEVLANKKNVSIDWITPRQIESFLFNNLDLAAMYFGLGDVHGFLGNNLDHQNVTQIQSNEYLDLSFSNSSAEIIEYSDLISNIKNKTDSTIFCLKGGAGSGKTLFLTKIALDLQPNLEAVDEEITLPVFIRLRDCSIRGLEDLIFFKKQKYNINSDEKFQYVYILDGLDELDDNKCKEIVDEIHFIAQKEDTKCIFISSRESSSNLLLLTNYFDNIKHLKVNPITYSDIKQYFIKKGVQEKIEILNKFDKEVLSNIITDVLLLNLFWEEICNLDPKNLLPTFLFELNVQKILANRRHNSYLANLNLPYPKEKQIIKINEEISWELTCEFKLKVRLDEIQNCVSELFPKLTYKDVNAVVNYLVDCFFNTMEEKYEYRHRRYQEYFYLKKLQSNFESNFRVLRNNGILLNFDFMGNLFIPYLKRLYLDSSNFDKFLRIKSLESYYNKHWAGEGGEYLVDGIKEIAEFLSFLDDKNFKYQISEDNPLLLKNLIEDINNLNYDIIEIFYSNNKEEYAEHLLSKISTQLDELSGKIQTSEDYENYKFKDLHRKKSEMSWDTYFRIRFYRNDFLYGDLLTELRDQFQQDQSTNFDEFFSPKLKAYKALFNSALKMRSQSCSELFEQLNECEIKIYLNCLSQEENLSVLFAQDNLKEKIVSYLKTISKIEPHTEEGIRACFYHCLLNVPIRNYEEIIPIFEQSKNDILKKRSMDVFNPYVNDAIIFCQLDFILKNQDREENLEQANALESYSFLFSNYIRLLRGETTLRKIIFLFLNIKIHDTDNNAYVKNEFTLLVTKIFSHSFLQVKEIDNLVLLKRKICGYKYINKFKFFLEILSKDVSFATAIINSKDLDELSLEINNYKDYYEILEYNLKLAKLYLLFDFNKAVVHFKKGINESLVRYGWRKDVFLNQAVDSFELLTQNNWLSDYEIEVISEKMLLLSKEVLSHIDGDGTRWAPYTLINNIANFNLKLAEKLLNNYSDIVFKNDVLSYILVKKANISYQLDEIEKQIKGISPVVLFDGKIEESYYLNRFKIYFEIAKNESYGEEKQRIYFKKCFDELSHFNNSASTSYHEYYLKSIFDEYNILCKKYNLDNNLVKFKEDVPEQIIVEGNNVDTLPTIIGKLNEISSKEEFLELFNHATENSDCMSSDDCLKLLVNTSLSVCKDIDVILQYLESRYYSSPINYDKNSKYDYLLVKQIISNQKAKRIFFERSYYSNNLVSYPSLIEVFVALNHKTEAVNIFYDYLSFCEFLIT